MSWNDLRASAPELAERAWTLLSRTGAGEGLLSTVNGDDLPRTHPVNVGIVDGRLLTFVQPASAKTRDLTEDGRYALHLHQHPRAPHELLIRGRATIVTLPELRDAAVAVWPFRVNESYPLFELGVEHVLFGERGDADTWPPVYTSWRPESAAAVAR